MAKDLIYYFDKITNSATEHAYRHELGEVQEDFNISLVLDGTKDSARFIVYSYVDYELEPFTILWHANTDTYWIVSHDKVERHMNENGSLYVHQVDVLGAFDLLNARDLTDCGFRSNKYTIRQFLNRLFDLSSFEFKGVGRLYVVAQDYLDLDQKVDYLKTFENYSLASAIREFLDGYNSVGKLTFNQALLYGQYYLNYAQLNISPKVGNYSLPKLDIDDFDEITEIKTIDKNSYGSTVVTNANNVVSTKVSVYPANGVARLKSKENKVVDDNGCIFLPSNVYRGISLTLYATNIYLIIYKNYPSVPQQLYCEYYKGCAMPKPIVDNFISGATSQFGSEVGQYLQGKKDLIRDLSIKATSFKFYDGFRYNAIDNSFKFPKNAPSDMKLITSTNPAVIPNTHIQIIFTDKATRDSIQKDGAGHYKDFYWERGSNLIRGFQWFNEDDLGSGNPIAKTIGQSDAQRGNKQLLEFTIGNDTYSVEVGQFAVADDGTTLNRHDGYYNFKLKDIFVTVEYIPMGDLKIKTDNELGKNDIHLYNQNGKLNDSNSLSKLINSYSKEITSDNITRNMIYYSFSSVPKVGQVVDNNGTDYVINNVSLDVSQNELEYYISAEITMSKAVAVKSLMVNANSNIRDYGIPQTNSVKRVQVYRDIFSLKYASEETAQEYSSITNFLSFVTKAHDLKKYVAFIRAKGSFPVYGAGETPSGTTDHYDYQLDTTTIYLKKQVMVKLDFQDNNIIGYDSQSMASNWSVNNFFNQQYVIVNTPIGYTDENGEVTGFQVRFLDNEQIDYVYDTYATLKSETEVDYFYNRVFLDTEGTIYDLSDNTYGTKHNDIEITEDSYYKDALEVPVFEYSCQLKDTKQILIGDNIFDINQNEDLLTFYMFIQGDNLTMHNALGRASNLTISFVQGLYLDLSSYCELDLNDNTLTITTHGTTRYNPSSDTFQQITSESPQVGKDLAVFRFTYDNLQKQIVNKEVVLIAKKMPSANISSNELTLYLNNYKRN